MENPDLAKAETDSTTTAGEDKKEVSDQKSDVSNDVKTENAATAPGKESTTTTEKPTDVSTPVGAAVGVEGYEKMLADAQAKAAKKTSEAQTEKWDKARAEAKADSEVSQSAPTPQEVSVATKDAEATTDDEAAVPPGKAEPETEETKLPERIRLAGLKDGHLVAAANTIAREENIPFAEAWDRVVPRKAVSPSGEKAQTSDTKAEDTPTLRSRADIQADIAKTKAEKKQAATDLDTGKMYESDETLETLRNELQDVDVSEYQAEENRKSDEQNKFTTTVNTSKAKAVNDWPEAGDDKSEFSKRMIDLADQLEKDPDPGLRAIVYDADAPFVIAKMVAKEFGLMPNHLRKEPSKNGAADTAATTVTKPPTSTAATKPAPVNQRAVGRPAQPAAAPASGAARTTQGGSEADALGLDKIHSVTDYENVLEKAKRLVPA
jgi:hypothetical protein